MTRHEGSMIRRRVLARQLRLMREEAGLTLEQAARRSVSPSAGDAVGDDELRWFTSSFSGGNSESCVEVAFLAGGGAAVRDAKDRTLPAHRYPASDWAAFLAAVRRREFDRDPSRG